MKHILKSSEIKEIINEIIDSESTVAVFQGKDDNKKKALCSLISYTETNLKIAFKDPVTFNNNRKVTVICPTLQVTFVVKIIKEPSGSYKLTFPTLIYGMGEKYKNEAADSKSSLGVLDHYNLGINGLSNDDLERMARNFNDTCPGLGSELLEYTHYFKNIQASSIKERELILRECGVQKFAQALKFCAINEMNYIFDGFSNIARNSIIEEMKRDTKTSHAFLALKQSVNILKSLERSGDITIDEMI